MIKPLPNFILISPIEEEETSEGGFLLPESSKDRPVKGVIAHLSPVVSMESRDYCLLSETTLTKEYLNLKIGSIVYYKKWGGEEIKYNGKDYRLIKFQDILAYEENT